MVEWSTKSLIRREGSTNKVIWDAFAPVKRFDSSGNPAHWMRNVSPQHFQGKLIEAAIDSNGDGTGDLLWYFPSAAAYLALSGSDGSMLWNYVAQLDKPGGPQPDGLETSDRDKPAFRWRYIMGTPSVADVDGDGTPDLIATLIYSESNEETARRKAGDSTATQSRQGPVFHRRAIEAVSGRTGRWLWSYSLDRTFNSIPQESWRRSAEIVHGAQTFLVQIMDNTSWHGLDPATGRPQVGPFDMGFTPARAVQHGDLDGDGEPEILALGPGPLGNRQSLHAFSITQGKEIWTATVGDGFDVTQSGGPVPECPMIVDLDGDGRSEIAAADSGAMPPLAGYRGVMLLDGLTGAARWHRPMRPQTKAEDGLAEIIAAP